MNRPAVGPQSIRGLPNGFPSQQLPQNRAVSNRLPPSGKMASNGATWAFGGGVPMGNSGLGNPRPNAGPMTSFAQTIGGSSQPATPLDLSEFPSLSNNQPQPSQSTWAASGARNLGPSANLRMQQSSLSSQQQLNAQQQTQQQQDDLFSSSSQLPSSQGGFRFGSQNAVGQASQSNSEEFPPLNRNANGEIGQDRNANVIQNIGFGAQTNGLGFGSANPPQASRNNGLLNALSGNNRAPSANRIASPGSLSAVSNSRSPIEGSRQGLGDEVGSFSNTPFGSSTVRDDNTPNPTMSAGASSRPDGAPQQSDGTTSRTQTLDSGAASSQNMEESGPEIQDPLTHMNEIDKWGLKGWSYMMNNFPDYAALVSGSDITNLGFDLNSSEPFSTQIYSLWDNEPSRPAVPHFSLPECYRVHNVAALETKIQNFNDEALIFMFYSNPGDIQQVMAAQELHNRNWRYHKKLQQWLTKDDMMVPQALGNGTERGYYIFFDIKLWQRERRELTLVYEDLENIPNGPRGPLS
ncbi:NOT2 family protein-like protein [Tricladium varicosporioides]|nr:NOT2 family protein-like protein [Hymenoscyphus varicosporioides]